MNNQLYQPRNGILTVKYLPNEGVSEENPPRFSWIPANEENKFYTLEIAKDKEFKSIVATYEKLTYNFTTLDFCLDNGVYYWRYSVSTEGVSEYSKIRTFTIDDSSSKTPVPKKENRFKDTSKQHPRLWLQGDKLEEFKAKVKADKTYCSFDKFYDNCVKTRLGKEMPAEALPYASGKREIPRWRQNYMDCQEIFNFVRFLSIAGVILDDKKIQAQAIDCLMTVVSWDVNGTTSRQFSDENAFRMVETVAWGYDWLYNAMDEQQRKEVLDCLILRTKDVAEHAILASKIHYSLFDSHAVRSLSSAIMPACIAMLFEHDKAEEWLNYTVDYLAVLYTPWGGADGGWAEGGLYWTTGMAYLISALDLLKNHTGIDLFLRPFFRATGSFPLYCFPHDTYRASFCDQSNLGEKPILKTGFNCREFAGITGNGEYQWYFEQIAKRESYNDTRFFNVGWWDFYFDEMVYLSNYDNVDAVAPKAGRNVKWFKDIGWVAVHKDMHDEKNHICMITKSSPYGSVSHSSGDQNAIVLFAFGEPLLIESGYYIGFNSSMHRDWRNKTCSKNALLINGQGQYDGMDKTIQLKSTGTVKTVEENENYVYIKEDATAAYSVTLPDVESCTREIYFVEDTYFVMVDKVEMKETCHVDFLLHSMFEPKHQNNRVKMTGEKAILNSEFIYVSSGVQDMSSNFGFPGVKAEEIEGLEKSWNFEMRTGKAKKHTIITCMHPKKVDDKNTIEVIKDDQGHDLYFYFNNDGSTFSLCLSGDDRY